MRIKALAMHLPSFLAIVCQALLGYEAEFY